MIRTKLSAIISNLNWVISNPEENNPMRGIIGIFPIERGVLKRPFKLGLWYRRRMTERFTDAKMMNVPKFVISATKSMLPKNTKRLDKISVTRIAVQGLPFEESFDSTLGKEPSLAIP